MDDERVGYGRPPKSGRFKKGQSGNPKGRPPGHHRTLPYEEVLGQMISVTKNGVEKTVTVEEAFLQKMLQLSAQGDIDISIALHDVFSREELRQQELQDLKSPAVLTIRPIPQGSVVHHLTELSIAKKLYAKQPHAAIKIENWVIELALERRGDNPLTLQEQEAVVSAARHPEKVKWPGWWAVNNGS